ncbi:MAG: type II toxin-antitoxin system HicA family toxin [Moraxellaceae bacterium]|nr:MAG: type II toxin-antitoxin system HicA family toxin [Moraxellaceae bacterium]
MTRLKHLKTLNAIFARPVSGTIRWKDIEALFVSLGAEIEEREGSRMAVIFFDQVKVFHLPHPQPTTDKGAIDSVRTWLEQHDINPDNID